ncbi:MAG: chemotaxis protein histidine kinase CheA [Oceanicoccus sp.]|jgi:chemotaxis protein histidine kinase CheA
MVDVAQHLDMDALSELKMLMGDEFPLLVETFSNDSIVRIEAIKEAVATAKCEDIRRAAHSFKGSAGNMAALKLTELCHSLEELAHAGVTDGCDTLRQGIEQEYDHVKAALQGLLQ